MSAVPKSLGVLPPLRVAIRPVERAGGAGRGVGWRGLSGPQLYDYALNNIEPVLEGIPGVASASINGGRQRQINVIVDPVGGSGAQLDLDRHRRGKPSRNRTRCCPPACSSRRTFRFERLHQRRARAHRDDRRRHASNARMTASRCLSATWRASKTAEVRRRSRCQSTVANAVVPECAARARRATRLEIVDAVKQLHVERLAGLADRACRSKPIFDQSTFVRTTYHGLKQEVVQALVLIALVILLFPAERARHADRLDRHPALFCDHADRALRERPDAQRLHPRRPDAGDGAPGRRRGGCARVDPPASADGHGHVRPHSAALEGTQGGGAARARIDAHHDGGAVAGAPPGRPREEAVRAARADRRRRDDGVVFRERVRDAGRPPLPAMSLHVWDHATDHGETMRASV